MTSCLKVFRIFSLEIPGDLILDDLASLDFVEAVVCSNDRASELVLTAVFFVGDNRFTSKADIEATKPMSALCQ